MKVRIILLLLPFMMLTRTSFAQFALVRLTAGAVFSNPTIKKLDGFEKKSYTDGLISLEGKYQFASPWAIVLDVGVGNRGMTLLQPVSVSAFDPYSGQTSVSEKTNRYKHSFFYLDNTLMARYSVEKKKSQVYANVGVYYSRLIKARKFIVDEYYDYSGYGGITEIHSVYQDDTNFKFNGSDVGFAFGAGVQYGRFGVDFRYNLGVVQISGQRRDLEFSHSFAVLRVTGVCFKSRSPLFRGNGLIRKKQLRSS
jgi:hypothetical protein